MTMLAVESMKLRSTRSPWWCVALTVALSLAFASILAATLDRSELHLLTPGATLAGANLGLVILMVMAALAVTTEYRFGTIRATFMAAPGRIRPLLAKTTVVALVAGVVGELSALAGWGLARLIRPDAPLGIDTAQEYRQVFGLGLYYALAAVIAVGVGILVRHTAGAIAVLLVWILIIESLLPVIPTVGDAVLPWLPFVNAGNFLLAGQPTGTIGPPTPPDMNFGPWGSLLYFAGISAAVLVAALITARRRDA